MPRRYYRRRSSGNRDKYSIENAILYTPSAASGYAQLQGSTTQQASKQFSVPVVPASDVQGMRKVKHFTLSFGALTDSNYTYALVYVPAGYDPNFITFPVEGVAGPLYEPNQYVISSGVLDFTGGPLRIRTPLSRNLNSGDSIHLVLATVSPASYQSTMPVITVNVRFAITLQ